MGKLFSGKILSVTVLSRLSPLAALSVDIYLFTKVLLCNSSSGHDNVLTFEFGALVFGYFTLYLSLPALRVSHPSWGQDTG